MTEPATLILAIQGASLPVPVKNAKNCSASAPQDQQQLRDLHS